MGDVHREAGEHERAVTCYKVGGPLETSPLRLAARFHAALFGLHSSYVVCSAGS